MNKVYINMLAVLLLSMHSLEIFINYENNGTRLSGISLSTNSAYEIELHLVSTELYAYWCKLTSYRVSWMNRNWIGQIDQFNPIPNTIEGHDQSATKLITFIILRSSYVHLCTCVCVCVYRYRWVRCNRDHNRDQLCWWKRKTDNSVCFTLAHSKVYRIPVRIKRFVSKPFHL